MSLVFGERGDKRLDVRLGHMELFCADPRKTRDFYRDVLGFKVEVEQPGPFIWMKLDGFVILLRPGEAQARAESYAKSHSAFVLYTEERERTVERLRERGLAFQGSDGSDKCPTFTDPDGHWFQLVDPRDH